MGKGNRGGRIMEPCTNVICPLFYSCQTACSNHYKEHKTGTWYNPEFGVDGVICDKHEPLYIYTTDTIIYGEK